MDPGVKSTEDLGGEQTVPSEASERWTRYRSPLQSYPFSRWHLQLTDPSDFSNGSTASSSDGSSILTPSGSFSSNSASGSASIDSKDATMPGDLLRSLKMTTLFKNVDPDRRICQFEIPGGGVCRDDKCEDLHIEQELETWEPSGASRIPQDGVLLTLHTHIPPYVFGPPLPWADYPIFSSFFNTPPPPRLGFPSADDDTAQYLSEALATTSGPDRWPRRSAKDVRNVLEETRTKQETTELGFEDRILAALSILGVS